MRRRLVEQPIVEVPAELVMGPRCDLWADPDHLAAFERASTAAERMTARDSRMIFRTPQPGQVITRSWTGRPYWPR